MKSLCDVGRELSLLLSYYIILLKRLDAFLFSFEFHRTIMYISYSTCSAIRNNFHDAFIVEPLNIQPVKILPKTNPLFNDGLWVIQR